MPLTTTAALTRAAKLCAAALLACVIVLHLGTLGLGEWQKDEFRLGAGLRDQGVGYMIHRFFSISPRPVSEILLFAYGELVLAMHRPLIGEVLFAGWAGLFACCCAPLLGRHPSVPRLFLALALFCLFILGHPVADMFYWPMAMAAYLPTVGGFTLLTLLILDDGLHTRRGRLFGMAALIIAAGSSELGAMAVCPFTLLMLAPRAFARSGRRETAWLVVPLLLSAILLLMGSIDRGLRPTPLATPTAHHLLPSLLAAMPEALRAVAMVDPDDGNWGQAGIGSVAWGLPLKALILAGFALLSPACFPRAARWPLVALAGSLVLGVFASTASAYLEFGFLCCQRHESTRQCLLVLALLATSGLLPTLPHPRLRALSGTLCLMLAMAPMMRWRLPDLLYAYRYAAASHAHLARLWATGEAPGPGPAIMQQSNGALVHAWQFPVGDHTTAAPKSDIFEAMRFFQKREIVVLPP